jgi:cytochrome c55X
LDNTNVKPISHQARIACLLFLLIPATAFAEASAADPTPERQRQLVRMVRQDCGACHGLTLKGGLGPPLLPETLRDKPVESLQYTVLLGRPGTPMPPWSAFLTEAEAGWIVRQLIHGFPEETR